MTWPFPVWGVCFLFLRAFVSTVKRGNKRVQPCASIEGNVFPREGTTRNSVSSFLTRIPSKEAQ